MQLELKNRKILITGGLGAIGEYIIKTLHQAGATLIITDIVKQQAAEARIKQLGIKDHFSYYRMDVTQAESVHHMMDDILSISGPLDTVLGHAGGTGIHPFSTISRDTFEEILQFNFVGQTYLASAILNQWVAGSIPGHLIFTSSYVARIPHFGIAAYSAAKAALEMFAKNIALEYGSHGIRVNCVAPGNVAAGSSLRVYEENQTYRELVDRVSPLGKRNTPQAIADAFLYLCSDLGAELNGHVLQVDMGVSLPKLG